MNASPSPVSDQCDFEMNCSCEVRLKDNDRLLIGCVYRSPHSKTGNNTKVINDLTAASNLGYSHTVICEDFNHPGIILEMSVEVTEMLDICIASRLRILNGRITGDICGLLTCHNRHGSSVVDYTIASHELLYLEVGESPI